ncbi:hypothetical protein DEO23_05260 [Brachybacterium endophyticum]|uniref:Transmembrane protein n=1 Tax=Brachybacterium endophyticum TaxID=2182385 RepID=A0A2U2RKT0_9MICO|nr:DUF6069 family protein [Brachybacterium endophyticum]PWH06384.1 hypothetical protein DEO23_05260 [Brachybacterium endophyticum]
MTTPQSRPRPESRPTGDSDPNTGPSGPRPVPPSAPGPARAGLSIVIALVAALLVWVLATPIAGLDLHAGSFSVDPGAIIPAILMLGVLAWALRLALGFASRGAKIWTIIAVAVMVLSLLGPIVLGASGGALVALLAMHLLVGGVLILGLRGPRGALHASRTQKPEVPSS